MHSLKTLKNRAETFARSRTGRRLITGARVVFVLGVVAWLVYRVYGIGWRDVWISRPRTPWFYVIWIGLYLQLPLVEALIYRALWKLRVRRSILALLHKRTLNQDVVSSFGEAYFFLWARHRVALSVGKIAGTLKDNVIATSLASWTAIVLLILVAGPTSLADFITVSNPWYIAGGLVLIAVVTALGVRFKRVIFTLSPRAVSALYATHLGRFMVLLYGLQTLQWWVVLPEAPLHLWAQMLIVITVVNWTPLIPAKDLVGISAILGVTGMPAIFEATIAAMLLVRSALDHVFNLAFFILNSGLNRNQPRALQTGA